MPADEVVAFEVHLLGCPRCQAAVREGAAVAMALRGFHRRTPWVVAAWTLPLAAAVIAGVLLLHARDPLRELGELATAPAFAGAPLRAAPLGGDALADSGMVAYTARRYVEATRLLSRLDEESGPGPEFYLGAARLMADEPDSALPALARAAGPRSPYAADAHYLRAKAWLRLGRADSALAELAVSAGGAGAAARARALADSIRHVRR